MRILFVCNSSVCRWAIAERITVAIAAELGLTDVTAASAAMRALVGFPMEPVAAEVVRGLGGDPDGFAARRLRPDMVEAADLVLTVTERLRNDVVAMVPPCGPRVFSLLEVRRIMWLTHARTVPDLHARRDEVRPGNESIADPVGLGHEAYAAVGDRIAELLLELLPALEPARQHAVQR